MPRWLSAFASAMGEASATLHRDVLKIDGGDLARCCGGMFDVSEATTDVDAAIKAVRKADNQVFTVSQGTPQEHVQQTYNEAAVEAEQHLKNAKKALEGEE
ncbi:unnamed protein product [Prorocentrum cordatum]|uniref:Uncharacterized protein n=1 Tax=Prorocentrum cordatum TaxID=2364126 RepID=A0ABN9Y4P3_9DINO|nr:unnamed protein product [Polarella glacialis]|mmetsp:Transcript_84671/g.221133  ORF Transcript_84671/g.221133 Transcript_84671/m.221133 type:complete len:101 (-) Transcript_84671:55-357(-)